MRYPPIIDSYSFVSLSLSLTNYSNQQQQSHLQSQQHRQLQQHHHHHHNQRMSRRPPSLYLNHHQHHLHHNHHHHRHALLLYHRPRRCLCHLQPLLIFLVALPYCISCRRAASTLPPPLKCSTINRQCRRYLRRPLLP